MRFFRRKPEPQPTPLIFLPWQQWTCASCGWTTGSKQPADLERNVADHIRSEWHQEMAADG